MHNEGGSPSFHRARLIVYIVTERQVKRSHPNLTGSQVKNSFVPENLMTSLFFDEFPVSLISEIWECNIKSRKFAHLCIIFHFLLNGRLEI